MTNVLLTVITPTTGSELLMRAVRSVRTQTRHFDVEHRSIRHLLVADGPDAAKRVHRLLSSVSRSEETDIVDVVQLPENVGSHGWCGHRAYAAFPWLVNSRYVSFLDEDNSYNNNVEDGELGGSPDVLAKWVIFALRHDLEWSYCLRNVYDASTGDFVTRDVVESVGDLRGGADFFVDTNCFLVRRDVAMLCSACWAHPFRIGKVEADRLLSRYLRREHPNAFAPYPHFCVNYTAGSTPRSVSPQFFMANNNINRSPLRLLAADARTSIIHVFHFNARATRRLFEHLSGVTPASVWDEWCLTVYDDLRKRKQVVLVDGYDNEARDLPLPSGAICVFTLCHPEHLPENTVMRRADVHKVLYAFESPNARHWRQWSGQYLRQFDAVITYWHHLLTWPRVVACPMICHPSTERLSNLGRGVADGGSRRTWSGCTAGGGSLLAPAGADVGIVLEDRVGGHTYRVCGTSLRCLDHLRGLYAEGLARSGAHVVAYGDTWKRAKRPGVLLGDCGSYRRENGHSVQLLRKHTYALVLENCDATGYVSEKLIDALCAGCVPLYYGNNDGEPPLVPHDLYVDLRQPRFDILNQPEELADGRCAALHHYLLSEVDVVSFRARIEGALPGVLRSVDSARFSHAVLTAARLAKSLFHEGDKSVLRIDSSKHLIPLPHALPRVGRVFVGEYFCRTDDNNNIVVPPGALCVPANDTAVRPWDAEDEGVRSLIARYNQYHPHASYTAKDLLHCPSSVGGYCVDGTSFLRALEFVDRVYAGSPPATTTTTADKTVTINSIAANDGRLLLTLCLQQSYLKKVHI